MINYKYKWKKCQNDKSTLQNLNKNYKWNLKYKCDPGPQKWS